MHHAIAGWPAWPEYADILGGRFLYRSDYLRGERCPDSGYRHDVTHKVSKATDIPNLFDPIFKGVPDTFSLTDELYLGQVFEEDVIPLFKSDYDFSCRNFFSAKRAVEGKMYSRENWSHPKGSNVVAWAKKVRNSPLVYLQFGDGPDTYSDPIFRRLVHNCLKWVGGNAAKQWASNAD